MPARFPPLCTGDSRCFHFNDSFVEWSLAERGREGLLKQHEFEPEVRKPCLQISKTEATANAPGKSEWQRDRETPLPVNLRAVCFQRGA